MVHHVVHVVPSRGARRSITWCTSVHHIVHVGPSCDARCSIRSCTLLHRGAMGGPSRGARRSIEGRWVVHHVMHVAPSSGDGWSITWRWVVHHVAMGGALVKRRWFVDRLSFLARWGWLGKQRRNLDDRNDPFFAPVLIHDFMRIDGRGQDGFCPFLQNPFAQ